MKPFYSEIILDHNSHPLNKGKQIKGAREFEVANASCGDKYQVFVLEQDGKIIDISFSGSGCALSQASADMMAEYLIGKRAKDIREYFEKFRKVIQTGKEDQDLGDLNEFCIVSKMPMRAKCAELPWTFCNKID